MVKLILFIKVLKIKKLLMWSLVSHYKILNAMKNKVKIYFAKKL